METREYVAEKSQLHLILFQTTKIFKISFSIQDNARYCSIIQAIKLSTIPMNEGCLLRHMKKA